MNPLFKLAILSGNAQAISTRLQHGGLVDVPDGKGYFPLMLAAEKGHFDICKLLIEHGADPDRKTPGNKTAADLAAENGHNDIVQLLAQFSQPPASVEEDSFEFWLSENTWEEDELPAIPPAQDAKLIKQAEEQEFQFSRFIPAVDGEDWTDIDLELPDVQLFEQNRKRSRLGSEYTDRVKDVIFHARQTGLVNIFRLKEEFGEHPSGEHLVDRLCEVLSGYDVLTDEYMPNLFDELFREDSSREEFFHDDAIDREIFRDFLHAYKDDGQVFFSYFADVASTPQIQGSDMAEMLEVRDKSVWSLLLLLQQCPKGVTFSSAWRKLFAISLPDQDSSADEDLSEPESPAFSSNLKQFYATFLKEFPQLPGDYDPVSMFKFLSIQDCDIDSVQNFFTLLLAALENSSIELPNDSAQWKYDAQRYLDMLVTSRVRMVEGNLRLSLYFARKYQGLGCEFADLVQEANIGLLRATGKYDSNREAAFATYAVWWIRQVMMRYIQNSFNTIRLPIHVQDGAYGNVGKEAHGWDAFIEEDRPYEEIPLWLNLHAMMLTRDRELPLIKVRLDLLDDNEKETILGMSKDYVAEIDPEEFAVRINMEEQIASLLDGLKEKEKEVLMLRFGIEASHDHTLEEIGQRFGVTRERIRQIEAKALRKMRHPLRLKVVEVFQDD